MHTLRLFILTTFVLITANGCSSSRYAHRSTQQRPVRIEVERRPDGTVHEVIHFAPPLSPEQSGSDERFKQALRHTTRVALRFGLTYLVATAARDGGGSNLNPLELATAAAGSDALELLLNKDQGKR